MTHSEIKSEILSLLRETGREGITTTINYLLHSDFFARGCHSHHPWTGGLAQHSLEACRYALTHRGDLSRESVILGTLLHDICTARSPLSYGFPGHGRRSVGILRSVCHLRLTPSESDAIRLHMHGDAPEMATNPLARLVWKADKTSAARRVSLDHPSQYAPQPSSI